LPLWEKIARDAPELGVRYFSSLAVAASTTIRSENERISINNALSSLFEIDRDEPSLPKNFPDWVTT
jgi:hypothetical protein